MTAEAGAELLIRLEQTGALTPTGLHLTDPDLPLDQAEALGVMLGRMHMTLRFAIGDWLLFCEQVYAEEFSQLSEALNLSEETRKEYMRVSQQVPRSRRRKRLDWSHHRAVAALPPAEQKEWLKVAEERQLSHHALRAELRNGKEPSAASVCRCCHRPYDTLPPTIEADQGP